MLLNSNQYNSLTVSMKFWDFAMKYQRQLITHQQIFVAVSDRVWNCFLAFLNLMSHDSYMIYYMTSCKKYNGIADFIHSLYSPMLLTRNCKIEKYSALAEIRSSENKHNLYKLSWSTYPHHAMLVVTFLPCNFSYLHFTRQRWMWLYILLLPFIVIIMKCCQARINPS